MDAQLKKANAVLCPFCDSAERKVYRREVKADHRMLHHCLCEHCGQHYQFAEDKRGKASVRCR